jgi:hypothetical protein
MTFGLLLTYRDCCVSFLHGGQGVGTLSRLLQLGTVHVQLTQVEAMQNKTPGSLIWHISCPAGPQAEAMLDAGMFRMEPELAVS